MYVWFGLVRKGRVHQCRQYKKDIYICILQSNYNIKHNFGISFFCNRYIVLNSPLQMHSSPFMHSQPTMGGSMRGKRQEGRRRRSFWEKIPNSILKRNEGRRRRSLLEGILNSKICRVLRESAREKRERKVL